MQSVAAVTGDVDTSLDTVRALRAKVEQLQGRSLDAPVLPTHPALAALLPGRGLRVGASYALGASMSLLSALLAAPSQEGSWCAVVGMPEFGVEAAAHGGVDLSRLVLVPDPGPRWLAITSAIAEVIPVVALRPPGRARDAEVARLSARMRDRGTVLLVQGPWPRTEAMIAVDEGQWSGLGEGHGLLAARELTVTVSSRRFPVPRQERMLLPSPDGRLAPVAEGQSRIRPPQDLAPLRSAV